MTNENRDNGSSATALMERAAAELEATAARVTQEALMRGVERGIREALPTMLATVSRALGGVMGGGGVVVREMPAQYAEPQSPAPVDRWGLVMTRSVSLRDFESTVLGGAARLVPISLSGDRIDRVPGYVGVAEPGESIDDAAARITDAWRHGKA